MINIVSSVIKIVNLVIKIVNLKAPIFSHSHSRFGETSCLASFGKEMPFFHENRKSKLLPSLQDCYNYYISNKRMHSMLMLIVIPAQAQISSVNCNINLQYLFVHVLVLQ